jgi:RHS repeat-associated protein
MNPAGRQQVMERKSPAVAYFYTATERRSRGVMWPSITPALTARVYQVYVDEIGEPLLVNYPTGGNTRYTYTNYPGIDPVSGCAISLREISDKSSSSGGLTTYMATIGDNMFNSVMNVITTNTSNPFVRVDNHAFETQYGYETRVITTDTMGNKYSTVTDSPSSLYPLEVDTTINDGQSPITYKRTTSWMALWDGYEKPIEIDEYDYSGTNLRTTLYQYYSNTNVSGLVSQKIVTGPGGGEETNYYYDSYYCPTKLLTGQTCSNGVVQSGAIQHTNISQQGNVTSESHYISGSTSATTSYSYDDAGNIINVVDPNGNSVQISYADSFADSACLPSGGNAAAAPSAIVNALGQTSTFSYYSCTGYLQRASNANGNNTTMAYDPIGRVTSIMRPDNGITTKIYNDAAPAYVSATTTTNSSQNLVTTSWYDGLARKVGTLSGDICVATRYDANGNVVFHGYPIYDQSCGKDSLDGTITLGDTYSYDALDRQYEKQDYDSDTTLTLYSGNTVDSYDPTGNHTRQTLDALGRTVMVYEPDANNNPAYETDYQYDPMGNLLQVDQWGGVKGSADDRQRKFTYDGLSRLIISDNPEIGLTNYTYDNNGNVISKKDARGITTNYIYDTLNRLTDKTYTEPTTLPAGYTHTDPIHYGYDQTTFNGMSIRNPIGHRTSMTDNSGNNAGWTMFSYDQMGRVNYILKQILAVQQSLNDGYACPHWSRRTYDQAGNIQNLTAYTGTMVGYTYDGDNRANSATWYDANGVAHPFVTNTVYDPAGHLTSALLGFSATDPTYGGTNTAQVTLSNSYNNEMWPITTHASVPTKMLLSRAYCYSGFSAPDCFNGGGSSGGNILALLDGVHGWSHIYNYDTLNRLVQADSTTYVYDAFGNKYPDGVTPSQWSFKLNNQSPVWAGLIYDAMGNVIQDSTLPSVTHNYTYDAEGRIVSVDGLSQYVYDGDGNRVARIGTADGGVRYWTWVDGTLMDKTYLVGGLPERQWYFNGELVLGGRNVPEYYLHDHLGSKSVTVTTDGTVEDDIDFLPYGAQATYSTNTSLDTHKFTGKERDTESGNDYFGARYYSSTAGRFMSPDPIIMNDLRMINPQRWNKYAYVINNPLMLTDPTGKDAAYVNFSGMARGFGHSGVMSIHNDGSATYSYKDGEGYIHKDGNLPTVQFDANNTPTAESYAALAKAVADFDSEPGKPPIDPASVGIVYFKTTGSETAALDKYIDQHWGSEQRYRLIGKSCLDYAVGGLNAAGVTNRVPYAKNFWIPNDLWLWLEPQGDDSNSRTSKSNPSKEVVTHRFPDDINSDSQVEPVTTQQTPY